MTVFGDTFSELGAPLVLEHFAETVTYRRPDGTLSVSTAAALGPAQTARRDDDRSGIRYDSMRSATFSVDAAAGGIADPQIGDEIVIGTETWYVRELSHVSDSLARAELVRKESHERGKPRYQG